MSVSNSGPTRSQHPHVGDAPRDPQRLWNLPAASAALVGGAEATEGVSLRDWEGQAGSLRGDGDEVLSLGALQIGTLRLNYSSFVRTTYWMSD